MLAIELAHRHGAIHQERAIRTRPYIGPGIVMFVGHLAEDFRQNVLDRHQPLQRAVFVHHNCEAAAAYPEGFELFFQRGGVRYEPGRSDQAFDIDGADIALVQQQGLGEVLGVKHPDDVVGLAAPERDAGMLALGHFSHDLGGRAIHIDGRYLAPVDHPVADLQLAQIQNATDYVAMAGFDIALLVVQCDGAANFVMRRVCRFRRCARRTVTAAAIPATAPRR